MNKQTKESPEEYLTRQNKKLYAELNDLRLANNRLLRDSQQTQKYLADEASLRVKEITSHKQTKNTLKVMSWLFITIILPYIPFLVNDATHRQQITTLETKLLSVTYASQIIEAYMAGDKDAQDTIKVTLTSDRGQDFNALITRK